MNLSNAIFFRLQMLYLCTLDEPFIVGNNMIVDLSNINKFLPFEYQYIDLNRSINYYGNTSFEYDKDKLKILV